MTGKHMQRVTENEQFRHDQSADNSMIEKLLTVHAVLIQETKRPFDALGARTPRGLEQVERVAWNAHRIAKVVDENRVGERKFPECLGDRTERIVGKVGIVALMQLVEIS